MMTHCTGRHFGAPDLLLWFAPTGSEQTRLQKPFQCRVWSPQLGVGCFSVHGCKHEATIHQSRTLLFSGCKHEATIQQSRTLLLSGRIYTCAKTYPWLAAVALLLPPRVVGRVPGVGAATGAATVTDMMGAVGASGMRAAVQVARTPVVIGRGTSEASGTMAVVSRAAIEACGLMAVVSKAAIEACGTIVVVSKAVIEACGTMVVVSARMSAATGTMAVVSRAALQASGTMVVVSARMSRASGTMLVVRASGTLAVVTGEPTTRAPGRGHREENSKRFGNSKAMQSLVEPGSIKVFVSVFSLEPGSWPSNRRSTRPSRRPSRRQMRTFTTPCLCHCKTCPTRGTLRWPTLAPILSVCLASRKPRRKACCCRCVCRWRARSASSRRAWRLSCRKARLPSSTMRRRSSWRLSVPSIPALKCKLSAGRVRAWRRTLFPRLR